MRLRYESGGASAPALKCRRPNPAIWVIAATAAAHLLLETLYRPWAWRRGIADFHFADSFTNATAVVGLSSVMVLLDRGLWADRASESLIILAPLIGVIGYEFLQPFLPWGTLDPWDIAWSFAGAAIAATLKRWIYNPRMRSPGIEPLQASSVESNCHDHLG